MSQYNSGLKAFTSGEALAARRRVKKSSGTVVYADAGEEFIGVTEHACASGEVVTVKLHNVSGTFKMTASEAFAVNTVLYGAADGKVADTENGSAQFYSLEAATADADIVECLPLNGASQAIHIGDSTTSVTLSAAGKSAFALYTTCASTSGSSSVEPFYMKSTMTGAAGVGGRARFHLYTNVALGGWANALKAHTEFGSSGRVTGLGSALCAELTMSAGTSSGTFAPLEAEIDMGASGVCGTATSFLYCNTAGAAATTFDTNGYFLHVGSGITAAATKFCSANYHTLKCLFADGSTTRYLFFSQTENGVGIGASGSEVSYTAGTPLVTLYATAAGSGSTNLEPMYVYSIMTGTSPVGGRSRFHTYANVACGGWMNALKGITQFGASGSVTGLASGVCGELTMSAGTSSGTYAALEAEIDMGASGVCGTATSFLYCNVAGAASTTFDTNGFLLEVGAGVAAGSGKFYQTGLTAATLNGNCTAAVRVKVDGTTYFIPLATATT